MTIIWNREGTGVGDSTGGPELQVERGGRMTDLEYRCVHGHDKCSEMYPGPECPYCERVSVLERAPFVKMGLVVEALWADAVDRPRFYSSMGLNFEKIIGEALAAARREGAEEMRERAKAACHERSQWAASKIANENADAMWATYSNACDDCLYFVGALPLTPEEPT